MSPNNLKPVTVGTRILVISPEKFFNPGERKVITLLGLQGTIVVDERKIDRPHFKAPIYAYTALLQGIEKSVLLQRPDFIPLDDPELEQEVIRQHEEDKEKCKT